MPVREITPKELKEKLSGPVPPVLIDVREQFERDISNIGGLLIPLGTIGARLQEIPRDKEVIIYCRSGARSAFAVQELETHQGFTNLWNLKGGILQWIDEVDSSLKKY